MIRRVWALTRATIQDGLRSQVFVNLLVVAVFALGMSLVLEGLTVGERGRVLLDVGIAATSTVNALLASFMTVRSMGGEEDRHTLLTILCRPVQRWEVVVGKFLGVTLLVAMNAAGCMGAVLAGLAGTASTYSVVTVVWATLALCVEGALVTAVTMLFSTFAGTTVAAVLGLGTYAAGLFAGELRTFAAKNAQDPLGPLVNSLYYAVPNLQRLEYQALSSPSEWAWVLAYAVAYSVGALALAALVFERRDLR